MRVITTIRMACCLPLLAVLAFPAGAKAQLDSGTGVQASREVATPPPPANARAGAARPGSGANRSRMAQAARRPAAASSGSGSGKNTPP